VVAAAAAFSDAEEPDRPVDGPAAAPPPSQEGPQPDGPEVKPPPTREEMRQRVQSALAEGRTTIDLVVADMYASMYATEQMVVAMMAALNNSRIARRFMSKMEKEVGPDAR
jgi:hypothetical protein